MRFGVVQWALAAVASIAVVFLAPPARALDLFGFKIFEPAAPEGSIPYELAIKVEPEDDKVLDQLKAASLLENQSDTPPENVAALVSRARADEQRLIGALYSLGYYGGTVSVAIAGQRLADLAPGDEPRLPQPPVPVEVTVKPGPQFTFGRVTIQQPSAPDGSISSDPADYGLRPGRTARSSLVLSAEQRLVDAWRSRGHPLAKIAGREVVADHASRTLDVSLTVDPGPLARFGEITIEGSAGVDPDFVRRLLQIEPGDVYSPDAIIKGRDRLRALNVFNQVRMIEGETLTADGRLPLTVQLEDRKPRYIGASASYSTVDGAEVNAYWGHRNLFGRAERLRIDATVSELTSLDFDDYQYELKAEFVKPAAFGIDTDFVTTASLFHERPDNDSYRAYGFRGRVGLTHRFSEALVGSLAAEGQASHAKDAFGSRDYSLVGVNGTIAYDRRDDVMNPTTGYRVAATMTPLADVDRGHVFSINRIDASAYYPLDARSRYVLAGRVALGSIFGTDLPGIPPERRFYAGGGGSLRGYAYQNVSPRLNGKITGGRGIAEASFELRARVTESIGIVPFVDMASVSSDAFPGAGDTVNKIGVGLGLRYYTAIGPIRLDVAVPLDPGKDDPDFAIYIGLGQSF
ncbi:autotransporter assembly complex protein TamA [Rhodoligotrophos defluvii]|uniref:autotransporter assembly complex protein TamA n=1 Tax=Rhodoligotrophos defluvii TaxID=2561934 RepID=UPI0010CA0876|nr:autotransporter assembly complex family protein [Rhodoligotrophos defluvii]